MDAKKTKARYIRLYSNGHQDLKEDAFITLNHYQEIEVYGLPAAPAKTDVKLVPLPLRLPLPSLSVNGPGAIYRGATRRGSALPPKAALLCAHWGN